MRCHANNDKTRTLLAIVAFLGAATLAQGTFNFYMDREEVKRMLGLQKELYYIREGVPNTYALNFVVPVQSNVSFLRFTWESLKPNLEYVIGLSSSDHAVLVPSLSPIQERGKVPTRPETFLVHLPCSGEKSAEILVELQVEFKDNSLDSPVKKGGEKDKISVLLKRKKVCLEGVSDAPPKSQTTQEIEDVREELLSKEGILQAILAGSFGLFLVLLLFLTAAFMRKRRKRGRRVGSSVSTCTTTNSNTVNTATAKSSKSNATSATFYPEEEHLYSCCDDYYVDFKEFQYQLGNEALIQRHKIRLQTLLLEGTFGRLYKATVGYDSGMERDVVVKTLIDSAPPMVRALFLHEGLSLLNISHPNLHVAVAVAEEAQGIQSLQAPPFLVYETGADWNLKKFLISKREKKELLPAQKLLSFGIEITSGLTFLHSKGIAHGDVAARCCCVTTFGSARLSDSALSQDFFPRDFSGLKPLRWSSPEILSGFAKSCKEADVWSLGILLWELFTHCKTPYENVPNEAEQLLHFLRLDRLPRPVFCPDGVYRLMTGKCWVWDVGGRGTVTSVLEGLVSHYH